MLEPATSADIPAIMALERGEGFDRLVGRWAADAHAKEIADPASRYFVWRRAGETVGFVMLQEVDSPNRCILLRRICVARPGAGDGSALLNAVIDEAFGALGAHRLDLWVFVDNERAYRTYLKAGFTEEGIARDLHRDPDGTFRSMRLMSILATDPRP